MVRSSSKPCTRALTVASAALADAVHTAFASHDDAVTPAGVSIGPRTSSAMIGAPSVENRSAPAPMPNAPSRAEPKPDARDVPSEPPSSDIRARVRRTSAGTTWITPPTASAP